MRARVLTLVAPAVAIVLAATVLAVVPGGNGLIAFTSTLGGDRDISVLEPCGEERVLVDGPAADLKPVWSPDGRELAFMSDRDGDFDIYVADADCGNARQLTDEMESAAAEEKFDVMNRVLDAARGLGITVLFVEHDMEIVRRYSDRVLAFCDGRILADGTPDVVLADAQVRELIIGETVAAVPGTAGMASEVAHA